MYSLRTGMRRQSRDGWRPGPWLSGLSQRPWSQSQVVVQSLFLLYASPLVPRLTTLADWDIVNVSMAL